MKYATILDTETNGFDHKVNKIIEIAVILYDLKHAAPITSYSAIVSQDENLVADINGIHADLAEGMTSFNLSKQIIDHLIAKSEVIVAHNAVFDKGFVDNSTFEVPKDRPWICSMEQIEWPCKYSSRSLTSIALAHGVPVIAAHRALTDCDILARLFTKIHETGHDLPKLLTKAMRPRILVQALVSKEDRQLAKDEHFNWDGDNKQWTKEVFPECINNFKFECKILRDVKPQPEVLAT
jgi:DNA polymerase-3 subunit epsilon